MSICPKCFTEYEIGVENCADCNVQLEDIVLIECDHCQETVNSILSFCTHCGHLLEESISETDIECSNHSKVISIGACVICGKPICSDCATIENGKVFCDNDEHVEIYGDWAVVYTCSAEYEAEMIKANIEMAGIKCLVFSQKDNVFFTNVGNIAVVNVMVPKENVPETEKIINSIIEGDFDTEDTEDENK